MAHIHAIEITNDQQYLIEPTLYIAPSKDGTAYTVNLVNFDLVIGVAVQAKFAATNDANATLKINTGEAIPIYYNNAAITANQFKANHVYTLVYDGTKWQVVGDIGAAPAVEGGYLPLSGGTMTGALNAKNNTWNAIGDDAYLGDINKPGHIGIQGKSGNTGIFFTTYNQTTKTTGGAITWDGTKFSITSTTAVDASISGNAATAGTADKATAANLTSTANAIAYYTNTTGTFGSKASANGVLYATSTNGALNWGILPIAQGGTGKTTALEAITNLGGAYINTTGTAAANNKSIDTDYKTPGTYYTVNNEGTQKLTGVKPAAGSGIKWYTIGGYRANTIYQIAGNASNNIYYRSTNDNADSWTNWYKFVLLESNGSNTVSNNSGTVANFQNVGSETQPIYVNANGVITAGTALEDLAYIAKPTSDTTTTFLRGDGAWTSATPSISITAGTSSAAPKINTTVLGVSGATAQELTKATTGVYGATKLYDGVNSTSTTLAATANAVKTAYDKANSITASSLGLSNALHFIGITSTELTNGSTTSTLVEKTTGSLSKTTGFVDGDVVMDGDQLREYVWSGSAWRLLGITTSTAYTQPASTATNTWIAQVSQGTDGKITATTGSLNTSGTWSGTATKASYPEGFSSRSTNATWGNQTGATVTCWNESDGGSIDIRKNNPSSGKVSIKVDGRFYGNEGNNPAMLMSDPNSTSYWGMGNPDGANNVWIRTTSLGILPFQSGGASAGHGGIGTSSWYFASSYIQNMYGNHIGNVTTSNITHIDGGSVNNGSWTTGATGTAPTATTTDGTTTYSGATIGTSILTLGNNKVGANSASGVANNAQGYLRLYSSGSAYGELTAYTTSSKTHVHATNGISFPENTINIMFRPGSGSYYTHVSYQTSGNEALVSATQNAVTSFIFVNGESYANIASDRWTKLTGASGAGNTPGLQIKQNCVSIGELIPSGTNPTYKLNVNGISNFKGNMTSTGNFYTSGRHISLINGAETDQFIDFAYAADPTVSTAPGASWRIGALNSGSGDGNYFVIQTGGSATNATTWNNALRLGMNTYDAGFGGNVYPLTNNSKTLGTSSLKWNNVYATTFTGNLTGNATSADSAKWFMNRGGSTVTISDGPWAHGQTGSGGTNAATVWHQRWKQSGLTYTPSGGSATTLTDSGDMVLWLAQSATSNALTVNMAIDGIIYAMGGFKGNLNGQASTVARATFGDSGNGEHNANNIKSNGMWYYTSNGPATTLGASTGDGAIYSQAYSTSWAGQIAQDYRDGALFVRGLNSGTWKNWYAIPKFTTTTGGLGSATQPVYIDTNGELQVCTAYSSASVNYAASAGSVAWDGVEDHPTDLNQFTNGPGYVTSSGVTSITLKAGAGITLDTNNTAITSTGTRTISINGINTSSGSTSKWLNQRGEWTTPPNDDTHHTAYLYAGANNATAHAAVSSGTNIYLCLRENSTQRSAVQIKQGTNMTISSDANGIITFTAKDTTYSNFVKSGTGAAAGLVPSPGTTAGTTKYLREDGTWQVPAYIADTHYTTHLYVNATAGGATSNAATANTTTYMHLYDNSTKRETIQFKGSGATTVTATGGVITISSTDNNTATATDNILNGSNSGTAITYAPYTTTQSKLSFDTSTTAPTRTDRLNLNGFLYATKYNVAGQVTLQYNSTDDSLDFIFA